MFREAIIAVTKAADWYALHPLTVEELRDKNIGSSVSIRYSTVGKNMTPMGNYEPSPINEGVGNVRKGQFRREIPEKAAEYFAYYLDEEGIEYVERTGTTTDEVQLAAEALIADGVDAVFTPTDNTIMTAELSIYEKFIEAGIPHYTGADSFALNGAFVGYGVDYANLGQKTADMIADILVDGADPSSTKVETFDNGTATVNTETCEALGLDLETIKKDFEPLCTQVNEITTAESFDDVEAK